jgi:peptidoglycan/xylan/chitin deacetylase (PgdA/CDA1 family)
VAVTVDDLPVHGPSFPGIDRMAIAEKILAGLRRHHVPPVYGFVNGKRVDDDPASEAILRRWLLEGNLLGNHTYSHVNLQTVDLADYFADLEKGERILEKLEPGGTAWKYFRYPFLSEGDTTEKREGVRRYLLDHGYRIAEVTISANDWAFNPPFARCAEHGDAAAIGSLLQTMVDLHVEELRRTRILCESLVHRDVRQILLLHIGAAEAAAIDDILSAYEREGVRWIDLPTALADPFYAGDPSLRDGFGGTLPERVARARGVPSPTPTGAGHVERDLKNVCPDGRP